MAFIVAIDGPSGAGKTTVAKLVASKHGFDVLDTGSMYRAVAWVSSQTGQTPEDVAATIDISLDGGLVMANGQDITTFLRTPQMGRLTSNIAALPAVREHIVAQQRKAIGHGNWVAEGRTIGSEIAPGADVKIFLTADESVRAMRRSAQLGIAYEEILAENNARDELDRNREHSPLIVADDAVVIDASDKSIEQVVNIISAIIADKRF